MYILYAKKNIDDPVFDIRGTCETWEECAKQLELLAADNNAVSFLSLENNDFFTRRWEYDKANHKSEETTWK